MVALLTIMMLAAGEQKAYPASELRAASEYVATQIVKQDAQQLRFLSLYNIPEKDRPEMLKVLSFWANSLSKSRRIIKPKQVTNTKTQTTSLYVVQLIDYEWSREAWEDLATVETYFDLQWTEQYPEAVLRESTGSKMAICRADEFIAKTSVEPLYSKFLGLGNTIDLVKKQFAVNEDDIRRLNLNTGGAVTDSIVALHNRQLERFGAPAGYFWQSRDTKSNIGAQNVLDAQNLVSIDNDAGEFIFSLPNGLQAYYLADKNGKQLKDVDPAIAQDSVTSFRSKTVVNARSCVVCHDAGIRTYDDVISTMVRGNKVRLVDDKKQRLKALEDFYLSDMGKAFLRDQTQYVDAVKAATDMKSQEVAIAFQKVAHNYLELRIDREKALIEIAGIGNKLDSATLAKANDPVITAILAGVPTARDAWEKAFPKAAIVALRSLQP